MGQLILPAAGRVYIDANAVIYSVEKIEPYWSLLQPFWQAVQQDVFSVVSSELVLMETLVKPIKDADTVLASAFRELLSSSKEIQLIPITAAILEHAAALRATHGLKPPDAIHAATALATHCNLIITNDPIFQRLPHLPCLLLKDHR